MLEHFDTYKAQSENVVDWWRERNNCQQALNFELIVYKTKPYELTPNYDDTVTLIVDWNNFCVIDRVSLTPETLETYHQNI